MESLQHKINNTNGLLNKLFSAKICRFIFAALFMTVTTTSFAAKNDNSSSKTAYVDSIHQWGPWELDIEPAAGGLQQAATRPLNARGSKMSLRTNSISALAPRANITESPAPKPVTPPAPITLPVPTITPISPDIVIPTGGPGS